MTSSDGSLVSQVIGDRAAHWYTSEGEPMHEIGDKKVTLREARKHALFPSVTGVIGMKAKPALDAWKQTQAIMSALTLPRLNGESDDEFARRVVEDAKQEGIGAAAVGSRVHAAIEAILKDQPTDPELEPYLGAVRYWLARERAEWDVILPEIGVANVEWGYGGRADLVVLGGGEWALYDFKTQKTAREPYAEWAWQLEAYARAFAQSDAAQDRPVDPYPRKIVSVTIPLDRPSISIHEWPESQRKAYWTSFRACLWLWKVENNYWPGEKGMEP